MSTSAFPSITYLDNALRHGLPLSIAVQQEMWTQFWQFWERTGGWMCSGLGKGGYSIAKK